MCYGNMLLKVRSHPMFGKKPDPNEPPKAGELLKMSGTAGWSDVEGRFKKCKALLDRGAKVDETDEFGMTPLMTAAGVMWNTPILRLLLDSGADIDKKNINGNSALFLAARRGNLDNVLLLLERGAAIAEEEVSRIAADQYVDSDSHTSMVNYYSRRNNQFIIHLLEQKVAESKRALQPQQPLSAVAGEGWAIIDEKSVAHITVTPVLNRKLTEIFNFETRERIVISENLSTHAESIAQPASFDSLSKNLIENALDEFEKIGGTADRNYALNNTRALDKKP